MSAIWYYCYTCEKQFTDNEDTTRCKYCNSDRIVEDE